ncbi:hypothetical protein OSH11_19370 [Kaistia dalseonensis]|uniref:Uncharacterized protein n=1 Tax=Kaistia dalseonensis TaxID=410840 RepID=A0ABU0HB12_9HYPH|nr:hypothetical protein [Kaistia dalseonensis]MCX5496876.1 hypothetical protein [Kaistia dalseonensis]MDQ0439502.1 hypothetical protein [Kaistia dalseonensis]
MPKLLIAPEGVGEHLWIVPENKPPFPVEIEDLDLSEELMDRIEAWGDAFDAIYDPAHPAGSSFPSAEAEIVWRAEGQLIAAAIRDELDDDWEIETKF